MAERGVTDGAALPRRLPRGAPKGQALRAILEELLASLPPGAALPSERELAERYGLARMTVRNEIERLTAEGSVYRLHGRGTFVAEPRIAQAGALTSFTEDMLARGQVPGSTVISSEVVAADGFLAAALEVKPSDSCFRLDRVRTADARPMAFEQVHLPLERFDGIDRIDFADTSLFEVLEDRFGVALGDAEVPKEPPDVVAELLAGAVVGALDADRDVFGQLLTNFDRDRAALGVADADHGNVGGERDAAGCRQSDPKSGKASRTIAEDDPTEIIERATGPPKQSLNHRKQRSRMPPGAREILFVCTGACARLSHGHRCLFGCGIQRQPHQRYSRPRS